MFSILPLFLHLRALIGFRVEKPLAFLPIYYIPFLFPFSPSRRMYIRLRSEERKFLLKIRAPRSIFGSDFGITAALPLDVPAYACEANQQFLLKIRAPREHLRFGFWHKSPLCPAHQKRENVTDQAVLFSLFFMVRACAWLFQKAIQFAAVEEVRGVFREEDLHVSLGV